MSSVFRQSRETKGVPEEGQIEEASEGWRKQYKVRKIFNLFITNESVSLDTELKLLLQVLKIFTVVAV